MAKKRARKAARKRVAPKRRTRKPARKLATPKRAKVGPARKRPRRTARKATPKPAKTAPRRVTKRSTGSPAGARRSRRVPALERERKRLREIEETFPTPPSSLNMDQRGSAARTGRAELRQARREHTQTGPAMTGGDVDADWGDAYAVGDEAPGGDNPTPDQDVVDDIGKSLGVQYDDNEELKSSDKIIERDKHRWELDPASAEDYKERDKE